MMALAWAAFLGACVGSAATGVGIILTVRSLKQTHVVFRNLTAPKKAERLKARG